MHLLFLLKTLYFFRTVFTLVFRTQNKEQISLLLLSLFLSVVTENVSALENGKDIALVIIGIVED